MRPLYFFVGYWGEKYGRYLADFCLASLLSADNLPLLNAADGHKLLVCTTEADWQRLVTHPIYAHLCRHLTPVPMLIGWPEDDTDTAKFCHMTLTQRLLTEAAYADRAHACHIFPDAMYSDGTVATILKAQAEGVHALLAVALRLTEDHLFDGLQQKGLLPGDRAENDAACITIPPAVAVEFALQSLYFDHLPLEWDADDFPHLPSFCYWRVAGRDEMIIYSSYFTYLFIDFSALPHHNTHAFNVASIENSWLSDNFPVSPHIRILQDSEDAMVISWTPGPKTVPVRHPQTLLRLGWLGTLCKGIRLRRMWQTYRDSGEAQKAHALRIPIRLHNGPVDADFRRTEAHAARIVSAFLGDCGPAMETGSWGRWAACLPTLHLIVRGIDATGRMLARLGYALRLTWAAGRVGMGHLCRGELRQLGEKAGFLRRPERH